RALPPPSAGTPPASSARGAAVLRRARRRPAVPPRPRTAPSRQAPAIARASARGARARPLRRALSCEGTLQDSGHHATTVEVLFGEVAREATVSFVIGFDRGQRAHRF